MQTGPGARYDLEQEGDSRPHHGGGLLPSQSPIDLTCHVPGWSSAERIRGRPVGTRLGVSMTSNGGCNAMPVGSLRAGSGAAGPWCGYVGGPSLAAEYELSELCWGGC